MSPALGLWVMNGFVYHTSQLGSNRAYAAAGTREHQKESKNINNFFRTTSSSSSLSVELSVGCRLLGGKERWRKWTPRPPQTDSFNAPNRPRVGCLKPNGFWEALSRFQTDNPIRRLTISLNKWLFQQLPDWQLTIDRSDRSYLPMIKSFSHHFLESAIETPENLTPPNLQVATLAQPNLCSTPQKQCGNCFQSN